MEKTSTFSSSSSTYSSSSSSLLPPPPSPLLPPLHIHPLSPSSYKLDLLCVCQALATHFHDWTSWITVPYLQVCQYFSVLTCLCFLIYVYWEPTSHFVYTWNFVRIHDIKEHETLSLVKDDSKAGYLNYSINVIIIILTFGAKASTVQIHHAKLKSTHSLKLFWHSDFHKCLFATL